MRSEDVAFYSDGDRLSGIWRTPDNYDGRLPAVIQGPGWLGLKDAKLYDTIGINRVEPNPNLDFTTWKTLQEYYVSIGLQPRVVDPNQYVDASYSQRALDVLGRE